MRRVPLILALVLASLVGSAEQAHATVDPRLLKVTWSRVVGGLVEPVAMAYAPGDSRIFIAERRGTVRVIKRGVLLAKPFIDLRSQVNTSGEGGLLGLAFKPDFQKTGRLFVAYTDRDMTLRVRRFAAPSATADVANSASVNVISIPHPNNTNHNGGQVAFGPGGYLFVGTGDGGGGGDPNGNAQNLNSLLGKILRLDVDHYTRTSTTAYSSPSSNPYYGNIPGRGEIWASGLRNPWRFSFVYGSTWLYVGDVGQGAREEIDRFHWAGANLGWDCREGSLNTVSQYGGSYCKTSGYTAPITEYDHSLGCAVIGGYTYQGARYDSLMRGHYAFGDYCSGRIWLYGNDANGRPVRAQVGDFPARILAFGRDVSRELYLLSDNGGLYKLAFSRR